MKKIFFMFCFFIFILNINAECSNLDIIRLAFFVNNINYTYDYHIIDDKAYFDVLLSNITSEMYLIDSFNNKYEYNDTVNGEIYLYDYHDSVNFKFYSVNCNDTKIGELNITFPKYNNYYNKDVCNKYKNLNVCKKWVNKYFSEAEVNNEIKNYNSKFVNKNDEEKIKNDIFEKINYYYINYYYIILPPIIIFGIASIIIINKKKKFNLLD